VIQIESLTIPELQAEVAHLREELTLRDQLVQQLSQELFRLVKGNTSAQLAPPPDFSERQQAEIRALREQLQTVEQQVGFYQEEIATKDGEIYQLRQSVQELTDRSQMLEQVVQDLPQVYKEKFEQRLLPLKEKIALIQRENRQLHAELQSVSYRLAVRSRRTSQLDLPSFPRLGSSPIPSFGS
jgi:chromosome segregation ATPase